MNDFPERVTLYDDGAYRWTYTMDMWHNRYILGLIVKIIGLLLGFPTLLALINALYRAASLCSSGVDEEKLRFFMRDDMLLLAVVRGMLVGFLLLALIVYAICAAAMHGQWRLRFQMDETAVSLVRNPGTMKAVNALGVISVVAGIAAGKPGEALRMGATAAAANANGTTRFESVRRVKTVEDCDVLDLDEILSIANQLCDILQALHTHEPPIVHRDIKPENIIVGPDGSIVLIDFDIARTVKQGNGSDTVFFGTKGYAPPEQYGFGQTDSRADISCLCSFHGDEARRSFRLALGRY